MLKSLMRGSLRGGQGLVIKKKKINEWPVVGLLLNQPTRQQARWPLAELAVRPSVSLLPIRPGTVKRSRGGLCRFVNLKHQETDKYLYHSQCAWHLSTLCKWHTIVLDYHRTTHKVQSSGAESHHPSQDVPTSHFTSLQDGIKVDMETIAKFFFRVCIISYTSTIRLNIWVSGSWSQERNHIVECWFFFFLQSASRDVFRRRLSSLQICRLHQHKLGG